MTNQLDLQLNIHNYDTVLVHHNFHQQSGTPVDPTLRTPALNHSLLWKCSKESALLKN